MLVAAADNSFNGRNLSLEVATVTPTTSLREGVQKMNELGIGSLVVQSHGKPVGMVTERDILRLVENGRSPQDLTVRMIMSEPVEVIGENTRVSLPRGGRSLHYSSLMPCQCSHGIKITLLMFLRS